MNAPKPTVKTHSAVPTEPRDRGVLHTTESGILFIRKPLLETFRKAGIKGFRPVETHRRSDGALMVRGIESGGAVKNAGHYVTFCDDIGQQVPGHYFYAGGLGCNARHAIVVAPSLIKIEMVREGCMYHLLITRHLPDSSKVGAETPGSLVERVFYGAEGYLEWNLVEKQNKDKRGLVVPSFFTPAGEITSLPGELMAAVRAATLSVNCIQCTHGHYVRKP